MPTKNICALAASLMLGCGSSYDADSGPPPADASPAPDAEAPGSTVRMAGRPPPPASGGTLLVTADGRLAIASDADTDRVVVVDLVAGTALHAIELEEDDEPGRLVEDGAGRVHVSLRRGGDLVTIDPASGTVLARRPVCGAPRGVVWEPATDLVHVACATGELVSLPAAGGDATRSVFLEPDLRDVVVAWEGLVISTFRRAELLVVGPDGVLARRVTLPTRVIPGFTRTLEPTDILFVPGVAWRMVGRGEAVFVLHQRALDKVVAFDQTTGSYEPAGPCGGGVVESVITRLDAAGASTAATVSPALLTDLAITPDGSTLWLSSSSTRTAGTLHSLATDTLHTELDFSCFEPTTYDATDRAPIVGTQRVSVAIRPDGSPISQVRLPNAIELGAIGPPARVPFGEDAEADTGHALFHLVTPTGLACASCHPEAGEDGHTWVFGSPEEPLLRRTQSLLGGVIDTAPFHWTGEHPDLEAIMREGFTRRMSGRELSTEEVDAVAHWLDALPAATGLASDPAARERGRALFESSSAGCAGCHAGEMLTDSRTLDVGTGGAFQVPSLRGVGRRAPFFHDGRAATVAATIDGTETLPGGHGNTASLERGDRADLVAYVEAL